jgi:hypothetical protein
LQNGLPDSAPQRTADGRYLSAALPVSLLDPLPAFGVAEVLPAVAPVLLVLRGPLLRLSLLVVLLPVLPVPDAPMLLLRLLLFIVSVGEAPSLAMLPVEAPVLDVLEVRPLDWQPAASTAARVTTANAAGRMDGLISM